MILTGIDLRLRAISVLALASTAHFAFGYLSSGDGTQGKSASKAQDSIEPLSLDWAAQSTIVALASSDGIDRPLFNLTRRPLPSPVQSPDSRSAAVSISQRPSATLTLRGILLSGAIKTALLERRDKSQTILLALTDSFEGWTLEQVESVRAVFTQNGQIDELRFSPPGQD